MTQTPTIKTFNRIPTLPRKVHKTAAPKTNNTRSRGRSRRSRRKRTSGASMATRKRGKRRSKTLNHIIERAWRKGGREKRQKKPEERERGCTKMETITRTASNLSSISRNISKYLHSRRHNSIFSTDKSFEIENENENQKKQDIESLLANLFARISSIKAAYAQLQIAQSPYNPFAIQSADQAIIIELNHIYEIKHAYYFNNHHIHSFPFTTYEITAKKLESDIKYKDSEIVSLLMKLNEIESVDCITFSNLNPMHFINEVRCTVRAIKSFVNVMVSEMESAGWDLNAAAKSIQPDVQNNDVHNAFAFESFVAQKMFSDFNLRDFGLPQLEEHISWNTKQFFAAFEEVRLAKAKKYLFSQKVRYSSFGKFCRAKYLKLVHPRMEASFFGDLDHREVISSCHGFPGIGFFLGFAEMARRVWMLHCLFFSYESKMNVSVYQVRKGCRFSEVYMENVVKERGECVGFTVMPGFRIGSMTVRSKVYLVR